MAKKMLVLAMVLIFVSGGIATACWKNSQQNGCVCQQFVDEDGDGICDLCNGCIPQGPDDDGDGIPNGQDDDYTPPQDGSGDQNRKGR